MTKQPKLALAPLSLDTVAQAGKDTAKAIVACEGAKAKLLTDVVGVANRLGTPLNAAQYDRQFAPAYRDALAAQVKRGKLREATASSYGSKMKTAFLALTNGFSPIAGESFWDFYSRAAEWLPSATVKGSTTAEPVWKTEGKAGRKAGAKRPKVTASDGLRVFTDAMAKASAGTVADDEGGMSRRPLMAAALILSKGNEARAQRLVIVAESYPEEFDRWTASILTDADRKEIEARTAPKPDAAQPTASAPGAKPKATDAAFPDTILADRMVAAQRKANAKQRKAA